MLRGLQIGDIYISIGPMDGVGCFVVDQYVNKWQSRIADWLTTVTF